MRTTSTVLTISRPIFVWGIALAAALGLRSPAQEVFREFTLNYGESPKKNFGELELHPTSKFATTGSWATRPRQVPKEIVLDLAHATGAELSVEYWGGHIGTTGQRFKVNGHDWIDLPQPAGTIVEPQRFHRTLLGNNAVPIPLAQLRDGKNTVQFTAGSQIPALGFGFGFYWIYDFTVRIAYDPKRPHPSGEIVSPKSGGVFGDALDLEARASSPNGAIARVEFMGEYDDFDWDGDGMWREWQFTTHHGVLQHHLGTATAAPWRATWDARWVPDQTQPVRIRARITDAMGLTYLTPPLELTQSRRGRSVRMFKSADVPESFGVRMGKTQKCTIAVAGDLTRAKSARLVVSTWSASTDDDSVHELRLNGERLANRFGQFHNYSFDSIEVPLARLRAGVNEIATHSTFQHHALEINWPGPILLVEYESP